MGLLYEWASSVSGLALSASTSGGVLGKAGGSAELQGGLETVGPGRPELLALRSESGASRPLAFWMDPGQGFALGGFQALD